MPSANASAKAIISSGHGAVPANVRPSQNASHSPTMSPRAQPPPQCVTPLKTYCQNGRFLSRGASSILRCAQIAAGPRQSAVIGQTHFITDMMGGFRAMMCPRIAMAEMSAQASQISDKVVNPMATCMGAPTFSPSCTNQVNCFNYRTADWFASFMPVTTCVMSTWTTMRAGPSGMGRLSR